MQDSLESKGSLKLRCQIDMVSMLTIAKNKTVLTPSDESH
jgi:hypothetical protein